MKVYKIYDKETGYYIATTELYSDEVNNLLAEFIIVEAQFKGQGLGPGRKDDQYERCNSYIFPLYEKEKY